ncbi:MFS general substrate transporter [Cristinia sonorae]|uniref:MFS general substrate transporter n=1 Tax=Cristinia sonorae TaxID=1940300 RepID=A0A8K0UUA2_9AGAR|nr:MFS general substrate transporter [Cristinia sonorae]
MHSNTHHPPALFSTVRIASLLSALLVALGSGTNYVFSAYGPQLGSRLHLSHTRLNIIALSGNIGVYGTAPTWGRLVDARGPRILLTIAFVCLIAGYSGIRHFYDAGLPEGVSELSTLSFCLLVVCGCLTGAGGNGGLASSMNATAKSFPDRLRATTTGLVISGFGLSAFVFSTIAHSIFPGDTSEFLLVLAIGTSLPMVVGFFLVKPVPLPSSESSGSLEHGVYGEDIEEDEFSASSPILFQRENNSHTHLLAQSEDEHEVLLEDDETARNGSVELHHTQEGTDYLVPGGAASVPLSPPVGSPRPRNARHRSRSALSISRSGLPQDERRSLDGLPNIHGLGLATSTKFWLLFTVNSLLAGTGLMYINNVGLIAQALLANGNPDYDNRQSAQLQALQVSTISVMNCSGRILIGLIADVTKNYLRLPRSSCIIIVATLFVTSQVILYTTEDPESLWKASAALGIAYGALFGLFPTITIEWFGLPHFSENWGFVSLAPMFGGNVFALAFGQNLDAHAPPSPPSPSPSPPSPSLSPSSSSLSPSSIANNLLARGGLPSDRTCFEGRACYIDTLKITTACCCFALALAIYAAWRDYSSLKRAEKRARGVHQALPQTEVLWEAQE